jgi:hypothetical protein
MRVKHILSFGIAPAADKNAGASGVFGGPHIGVAVSNKKRLAGIDAGKAASGKYHLWRGFAALTFFIRAVRTVKGGLDASAVFLNPANDSFMSFPEIAPVDKTPIDSRLVADQNDAYVFAVEVFERFEGILVKADFFQAFYIIGPVHIQNAVPVHEDKTTVFRLGAIKP